MDTDKLNQEALKRAEQSLSSHFSSDAYIVYSISKYLIDKSKADIVDYVEGTTIDEEIQNILNLFIKYSHSNDLEECKSILSNIMVKLKQIITELYMLNNNNGLRGIIKNCLSDIMENIEYQ